MSMILDGSNGVTFNDSSLQGAAASPYVLKNRIINGAMMISQRGTSFSTPANNAYALDRWFVYWSGAAVASVAQIAGPTGFKNALQVTGAASNTQTAIIQRIESYNCSDLSGATITIQANIAVSSAQTVAWYLYYANSADSFGSKTVISNGTWSATSTATTFSATITGLPANSVNGIELNIFPNNTGAFTSGTITITGVQLEIGTSATPFERRLYGQELALCQRYYQRSYTGATYASLTWQGYCVNTTWYFISFLFPVQMRATPTMTYTNVMNSSFTGTPIAVDASSTALVAGQACNSTNNGGHWSMNYTATAEL